jgi:hypothetical protein
MVQGVGVITYWVSNYVMDIIKYAIFAGSGIGLIKVIVFLIGLQTGYFVHSACV